MTHYVLLLTVLEYVTNKKNRIKICFDVLMVTENPEIILSILRFWKNPEGKRDSKQTEDITESMEQSSCWVDNSRSDS
jgi:hypothetical protein